jgi:aspartyl-tRNA synthetase
MCHNCGELNAAHINSEVTLAGWVQKSRDKGFMNWIDLRDRWNYTIDFRRRSYRKNSIWTGKDFRREFVIQVKGTVIEREAKTKTSQENWTSSYWTNYIERRFDTTFTIEDETWWLEVAHENAQRHRQLSLSR